MVNLFTLSLEPNGEVLTDQPKVLDHRNISSRDVDQDQLIWDPDLKTNIQILGDKSKLSESAVLSCSL